MSKQPLTTFLVFQQVDLLCCCYVLYRKRVLFHWLFSTAELVFSLPEADVFIAIIVLTDVKPYKQEPRIQRCGEDK
jgi:hypothetical protein